jgi:hypothetical protein
MTDINQNFSLVAGNDTDVAFDIGPDEFGTNLDFAESITWTAYRQILGAPQEMVITKSVGSGISIDDPLLMQITVTITGEDTVEESGNYYHEIKMVANHGQVTTTTTGLMTVINTLEVPNVIAFKAMFQDFADLDDTLVQIALDTAARFVDDSWGDAQAGATMYLAAHFLASAHATADTDGRVVSSETIGRMSISYATGTATGDNAMLSSTRYGLVFNNLLTAQGYGIAIV